MLSNILYVFTHGGGSNSDKGDDAKDCFVGGGDDVGAPPLPPEQLLQLMQQQQQITAAHPPPQLCCTQCTVHPPPLQCCRTGLRCRAGGALLVLQLSRQRTRSCLPSTFTDPPLHQHRPCSGLVLSVKVPTPNVCTDGKERC